MQSLENKVKEISNLNDSLTAQNECLKRRINDLEVEVLNNFNNLVIYLSSEKWLSVLANCI